MRLKSIKIAGFKSFVDPTTIPLIGNLAAVVGPNGCGKSNVIDAVRWVMGESSAKKLRGGELADVIFNGSSARKPLGQASVELHFDNTLGALGGEYASYNEISIRRLVTRDGQSQYFLNGTKCRRRDITDIFLGTGLGPRSYAIIEQGMISRVIEAKPEDLRSFVEEAAGISKYKERRRETENRIRHTRENLERLTDLREELDKQLKHLQRQSESAEKFKTLKADERLMDAQLAALNWSYLDEQIKQLEYQIREAETNLEKELAQNQSVETQLEVYRDSQVEAQDNLNEVQEKYYHFGSEIARIEQTLKHQQHLSQTLEDDYHQASKDLEESRAHLANDLMQIESVEQQLETLRPELETFSSEAQADQTLLEEQEFALETWREQWEASHRESEKATRQADVEKTKIAQLEKQITQQKVRQEKLIEEKDRLRASDRSFDEAAFEADIEACQVQVDEYDTQIIDSQNRKRELAEKVTELKKQVNQDEKTLASTEARLQSLETLQQTLQEGGSADVQSWLKTQGLETNQRLYQTIDVEPRWQHAVETVLGDALESILIDKEDLAAMAHAADELQEGAVTFVMPSSHHTTSTALTRLADKVQGDDKAKQLLQGVYVAEDVAGALAALGQLAPNESVITDKGLWVSNAWMRVKHQIKDKAQSALHRQQEIKELTALVASQTSDLEGAKETLSQYEIELQEIEDVRETYQFDRNQAYKRLTELKYNFQTQKDKVEHLNARTTQIQTELDEMDLQVAEWQTEIDAARQLVESAIEAMTEAVNRTEQLEGSKESIRQAVSEAKEKATETKARQHECAMQLGRLETELEAKRSNISRFENQIQNLEQRLHQISEQRRDNEAPIDGLKQEMEALIEQRLTVEENLTDARERVSGIENAMRELERSRHEIDGLVGALRTRLEQDRMKWQALTVKRETEIEKLGQTDFTLKDLLEQMPAGLSPDELEAKLVRVRNQIERLGPINLAAIDEYSQQSERKTYLDRQDSDLNQALSTLENAISKIDKETKHRFRETFERINANFQDLFPRLFGGGHATLTLTSDDLLETGMSVMARPPGKKNTTIHLLSGGEKALTAVSLVFSIFQLNPAPFCMLDEVDAPLDDYNVGRFCNLVKEMSKTVQFIYISHNKLALEMADQLQGVTMKEPGVSRIVTVDVEEAQTMAEA